MCLGRGEHRFDEIARSGFCPCDCMQLVLGCADRADERVAVSFEVVERQHAGSAPRRHSAHRQRARAAGRAKLGSDGATPGLEVCDLRAERAPGGEMRGAVALRRDRRA